MTYEPVLWLRGKQVALGPTHAELLDEYWRWENDPVTVNGYGRQVPESLETRREGYDHQARGSLNQVRFTVHDLKNEAAPCGLTSLTVDHQVRTAEFLILLAPEARGRGLATEATRLTLDYAFHLTALAQVWLKVLEPNASAKPATGTASAATNCSWTCCPPTSPAPPHSPTSHRHTFRRCASSPAGWSGRWTICPDSRTWCVAVLAR